MKALPLAPGPVEYDWWGPLPDQAPTLVLLHEGLGSVAQWKDFPRQLSDATGWGILAYSRHGYGGSAPIALPRSLTYLHDESVGPLPDVLAALGVQRHVLLGHSDGGTIALLNAALAPAIGLAGIVALAPHVFVEDVTIAGIGAALTAYQQDHHEKSLRRRLARYHGDNVDLAFHGWAQTWLHPDYQAWSIEAEMAEIRVPSLLIQGRQDEYATLEQLDRIETHLSAPYQRVVIEECGHSPHLQHPNQVIQAVTRFLNALP